MLFFQTTFILYSSDHKGTQARNHFHGYLHLYYPVNCSDVRVRKLTWWFQHKRVHHHSDSLVRCCNPHRHHLRILRLLFADHAPCHRVYWAVKQSKVQGDVWCDSGFCCTRQGRFNQIRELTSIGFIRPWQATWFSSWDPLLVQVPKLRHQRYSRRDPEVGPIWSSKYGSIKFTSCYFYKF